MALKKELQKNNGWRRSDSPTEPVRVPEPSRKYQIHILPGLISTRCGAAARFKSNLCPNPLAYSSSTDCPYNAALLQEVGWLGSYCWDSPEPEKKKRRSNVGRKGGDMVEEQRKRSCDFKKEKFV